MTTWADEYVTLLEDCEKRSAPELAGPSVMSTTPVPLIHDPSLPRKQKAR